jgi:pimeloyl-ACP methyl ester carboxylesterase
MHPGDILDGRFELDRSVGGGGMGLIYRAIDHATGGLAAVKLIHVAGHASRRGSPEHGSPNAGELRFLREAETLAALRHPRIVDYLAHGRVDDELYLAMEWLEGEDLAARLEQGDLTVEDSVAMATQIASALGAAHAIGIVHRDVKPSNVFLVDWRVDRVKLLDFGIARRAGLAALTMSGHRVGTPVYMAPEQARGQREVDARADVYALGTLLYRSLTGQVPFAGATPDEVIAGILSRPAPRVRAAAPHVTRDLDALVARMMEKEPEQRPQDGAAVHAALVGIGATAASPPAAPRRGRPGRSHGGEPPAQDVRFCQAADGVQLAYATVGAGPPVVRVAHWITHLEHERHSPVMRHLLDELAYDHLLVRYDARSTGLSERVVADVSFGAFVADLETVVDAAGVDRFSLVGMSQGAAVAIEYAARHPERVTRLVLIGGYARGWRHRSPEESAAGEAMMVLVRQGWGADNPAFRQLFASLFIPDSRPEQARSFNELARVAASPEAAARILETLGDVDVSARLAGVTAPTLVVHATHDGRCPYEEGLRLARSIPGARFVSLESRNHIILAEEPAWPHMVAELRRFLGG